MANALSRKATRSLGYMQTIYYPLLVVLRDIGVKLEVDHYRALLASFHVLLILIDRVREA